jgi:Iap family predicted aminopeptidase
MAALTETSRVDGVSGNRRFVEGTVVITADADTWAPGLGLVDQVLITPTTVTAGQLVGATRSGGTVTFAVEGGTPTLRVTAFGYG